MRIEFSGAVYHVTARGNERKQIYWNDKDRELFLERLSQVHERFQWIIHAYVLMENHYHLMIETPKANLSRGMRQLNGVYTQEFNRRHGKVGHLFQGRYKAILVEKESYLLEVSRYIVLNPVRAGMVDRPEEHRWSSYRSIIGIEKAPHFLKTDMLLAQFGKGKKEAVSNFKSFVMGGVGEEYPTDAMHAGLILGSQFFLEKVQERIKVNPELIEIPRRQRYASRESLQEIFKTVATGKRERNERICQAYFLHGYTMKEIADYLGLHYATVSRVIRWIEKREK